MPPAAPAQPDFAPPPPRLLLVEDDRRLAAALLRGLRAEGFAVTHVARGDAALEAVGSLDFDALILDRLLPGGDGGEVCRVLRGRDCWVPVLMLTALGEIEDRID